MGIYFIIPILILVFSISITWSIKWICNYYNLIENPREDRWNQTSIPKFGGIALFSSFLLAVILIDGINTILLFITVGGGVIFLLGLMDDIFELSPVVKLVTQILLAIISYQLGLQFLNGYPIYIAFPFTLLWIVGIINAMNLLDNMDGLCAGISAIIAFIIAVSGYLGDDFLLMQIALTITAICLGFLVFNFHPAKIFMGDSGSMFLGFLLATLSLYSIDFRSTNLAVSIFLPVMLMGVPIMDTTLVTINRLLHNRKVSQGGKDHTSHRLVQLGFTEKKAVLFIYMISFGIGITSLIFQVFDIQIWLTIILLLTIALIFFGIFLSDMKIYTDVLNKFDSEKIKDSNKILLFTGLQFIPSYFGIIFELLTDIGLIVICYSLAFILQYGSTSSTNYWETFSITLPFVMVVKILTLSLSRIYGAVWRYFGIPDLMKIIRGIILSSIILGLCYQIGFQLENISISLLIIDFSLACLLIAGSRLSFRILAEFIEKHASKTNKKNILIFGAGDAGNEVLRSINNNVNYNYNVVGFIDDNKRKKRLSILGVPILGGQNNLHSIANKYKIDEIIISIHNASYQELEQIYTLCDSIKIPYKKASWVLESKLT